MNPEFLQAVRIGLVVVAAFSLAGPVISDELSPESGVAPVHLFILSGQSNMAGLDPEISFIPTVHADLGKDNVLVVKDAQSGQPIRRWVHGWAAPDGKAPESTGDLYNRLLSKVRAQVAGRPLKSVTFVWMQGERDAREGLAEVYSKSFLKLVGQLESDLQFTPVHSVIGRLSDFDMSDARYPHWTKIRTCQESLAQDSTFISLVNTDDLNGPKDDLHYDKDGYRVLGQRFAEAAIKAVAASSGK